MTVPRCVAGALVHRWRGKLIEYGQIETSVVAHLLELVDEADKNKDGKIDFDEFEFMSASFARLCV